MQLKQLADRIMKKNSLHIAGKQIEITRVSTPSNANGFSYFVSDEQLAAFAKMSDLERLQWVEDARLFTLMAQTSETKARHEALRKPA
jgi:hypothetical protein